ncbi:hypothetical protein E3N88_29113 [Mikania micrantha]|uniref:Uncharacterized protein n=1 Tax=Mikania micrantha TaxID=192012 RepID=A0A5N6N4C5_9ASTR|nr:hypothetical protein E3N88_29113 [Mikania micrantha]
MVLNEVGEAYLPSSAMFAREGVIVGAQPVAGGILLRCKVARLAWFFVVAASAATGSLLLLECLFVTEREAYERGLLKREAYSATAIQFALKTEKGRSSYLCNYGLCWPGRALSFLCQIPSYQTRLTSYQPTKGCEAGPVTKNESISVHGRAGGRSTVQAQCSGIGSDSTKVECLVEGPVQ